MRKGSKANPCSAHGVMLHLYSLRTQQTGTTPGRVGFIVAPRLVENVKVYNNHQLGVVTTTLAEEIDVSIMQAYAPTIICSEELQEHLSEEFEDIVRRQKSSWHSVVQRTRHSSLNRALWNGPEKAT